MNDRKKIQSIAFLVTWIVFLCIALIKIFLSGFMIGLQYTLLLWCTLVVLTPIPEGGIIVSYPLQEFVEVHMAVSQSFVLLFSCIILFLYYKKKFAPKGSNWLLRLMKNSPSSDIAALNKSNNWINVLLDGQLKTFVVIAFVSAVATFAYTFLAQEVLNEKRLEVIISSSIVGVLFTLLWFVLVGRLGYRNNLHKKFYEYVQNFSFFSRTDQDSLL